MLVISYILMIMYLISSIRQTQSSKYKEQVSWHVSSFSFTISQSNMNPRLFASVFFAFSGFSIDEQRYNLLIKSKQTRSSIF
jgi:hypothetical protein